MKGMPSRRILGGESAADSAPGVPSALLRRVPTGFELAKLCRKKTVKQRKPKTNSELRNTTHRRSVSPDTHTHT